MCGPANNILANSEAAEAFIDTHPGWSADDIIRNARPYYQSWLEDVYGSKEMREHAPSLEEWSQAMDQFIRDTIEYKKLHTAAGP